MLLDIGGNRRYCLRVGSPRQPAAGDAERTDSTMNQTTTSALQAAYDRMEGCVKRAEQDKEDAYRAYCAADNCWAFGGNTTRSDVLKARAKWHGANQAYARMVHARDAALLALHAAGGEK